MRVKFAVTLMLGSVVFVILGVWGILDLRERPRALDLFAIFGGGVLFGVSLLRLLQILFGRRKPTVEAVEPEAPPPTSTRITKSKS